jgi:predicted nuclease of predicted toxin-antitoxin system
VKLLADECCDAGMVAALREDGHDVLYAMEDLRGASDEEPLALAMAEERLLLTEDKDFGELVYALKRPTQGIVLLRFEVVERAQKVSRIRELLEQYSARLAHQFVVLASDKVRLRPILPVNQFT